VIFVAKSLPKNLITSLACSLVWRRDSFSDFGKFSTELRNYLLQVCLNFGYGFKGRRVMVLKKDILDVVGGRDFAIFKFSNQSSYFSVICFLTTSKEDWPRKLWRPR
jgi:hypothetical protein